MESKSEENNNKNINFLNQKLLYFSHSYKEKKMKINIS